MSAWVLCRLGCCGSGRSARTGQDQGRGSAGRHRCRPHTEAAWDRSCMRAADPWRRPCDCSIKGNRAGAPVPDYGPIRPGTQRAAPALVTLTSDRTKIQEPITADDAGSDATPLAPTLPWRGRVDAAGQRRGGVNARSASWRRRGTRSRWRATHPTPDLRSDPPPPGEGEARRRRILSCVVSGYGFRTRAARDPE